MEKPVGKTTKLGPRARRVREFERESHEEKRLNSDSIRRLLFDTIVEEFDSSCEKASSALSVAASARSKRRGYRNKSLSADSLYKIAMDKQLLGYSHLNALATYYRIPISLLLLFTRLRSDFASPDVIGTRSPVRVLQGIGAALRVLDGTVADGMATEHVGYALFNHELFKAVVTAYQDAYEEMLI